jgi:hypothetical protein
MTTDMPDWEIREEMWIMFNKELSEQSPSVWSIGRINEETGVIRENIPYLKKVFRCLCI